MVVALNENLVYENNTMKAPELVDWVKYIYDDEVVDLTLYIVNEY